jgi:hypothetical protein
MENGEPIDLWCFLKHLCITHWVPTSSINQPFDTIINDNKKLIKQKEAVLVSKRINQYKNKGSVFLNSDLLLLLLELHGGGGGGGGGLKVGVKQNIFFWVCRFGIVALFSRLFCFWVLLCCCVCVCFLCLVCRAK